MGLVAVIGLTLSLTACATTTKIAYVLPEVVWPVFPKPGDDDVEYVEKGDKVLMSIEYYNQLKDFKTDYKATKKAYELTKQLYEGVRNDADN